MSIKNLKEKIATTAVMVMMLPQTVFASEIQKAIESSKKADFDSMTGFVGMINMELENMIAYAGAFALLAGVVLCLFGAPFKKLRYVGYGCLGAAAIALIIYLLLPTFITMIGSGG